MYTYVTGSGYISFYWMVSSESGWDYLRFYDDATLKDSISGSTSWAYKYVYVSGPGSHQLKWSYSKDSTGSVGSDCGWIDYVTWSPESDSLTLTTPSTTWYGGSYGAIYWSSTGSISYVNIKLYDSSYTLVATIATGTSNDGYYYYSIPSTLRTGYYYLYIEDNADYTPTDWSLSFYISNNRVPGFNLLLVMGILLIGMAIILLKRMKHAKPPFFTLFSGS